MSRGSPICDVCRKPCEEIVGKMFYTPLNPGGRRAHVHSRYTHHLDVGNCCGLPEEEALPKILRLLGWRPRISAKQYYGRGGNGVRASLEKTKTKVSKAGGA